MSFLQLANDFAAQHHLVPVGAIMIGLRQIVRPALVDFRAFLVSLLAIGFALASHMGVTPEVVDTFRPRAEGVLPGIPEASNVVAVVSGVVGPNPRPQ